MKNDELTQLWNSQPEPEGPNGPEQLIQKAQNQRSKQYISIAVMGITVVVLLIYAGYYLTADWNPFSLGLTLMISSLSFRIILELRSLYRKESQLITLDPRSFKTYLKKYHRLRLWVNYIVTPICFAIYIVGFTLLLPYFKKIFSQAFYLYLLISGFGSLLVIALIIIRSTLKERAFLKQLNAS